METFSTQELFLQVARDRGLTVRHYDTDIIAEDDREVVVGHFNKEDPWGFILDPTPLGGSPLASPGLAPE